MLNRISRAVGLSLMLVFQLFQPLANGNALDNENESNDIKAASSREIETIRKAIDVKAAANSEITGYGVDTDVNVKLEPVASPIKSEVQNTRILKGYRDKVTGGGRRLKITSKRTETIQKARDAKKALNEEFKVKMPR